MVGQTIRRLPPGLKPQELCGIPERLILALQADGWYWRSTVIWAKPNPMPQSVNGWRWEQHRIKVGNRGRGKEAWRRETGQQDHDADGNFLSDAEWIDCPGCPKCRPNDGLIFRQAAWRPTASFEYLYLLTKSLDYFGDAEAVKEVVAESTKSRDKYSRKGGKDGYAVKRDHETVSADGKRNRRNVWTIATHPYKGAHFATFPEALVEPCILAGTSEKCCPKCGTCWSPVIKKKLVPTKKAAKHFIVDERDIIADANDQGSNRQKDGHKPGWVNETKILGYKPSCACADNDGSGRALCFDPFSGAGTTALVAKKLGRDFLGVELNPKYIKMAKRRLK